MRSKATRSAIGLPGLADGLSLFDSLDGPKTEACDAKFIAHCRADVPALCETIEALQRENSMLWAARKTESELMDALKKEYLALRDEVRREHDYEIKLMNLMSNENAALLQENYALRDENAALHADVRAWKSKCGVKTC